MVHASAGTHVRHLPLSPPIPPSTHALAHTHTPTDSLSRRLAVSLSHLAAVVANFEFAHMRDGGRQRVRLAAVLYRGRLQAGQHCGLACLQELDDLCVVIVCVNTHSHMHT